jgi:hypothetical protein
MSLRKIFILVAVLLSLVSMGCSSGARVIQAQTANAIAGSANGMLPLLLDKYDEEGMTVLRAVKDAGGNREDALAAIEEVKRKWKPVWLAWDTLQLAHDRWATLLEKGSDTSTALKELKSAYCRLRAIFPSELPVIPLGIVQCEEQEKEDESGSIGSSTSSL